MTCMLLSSFSGLLLNTFFSMQVLLKKFRTNNKFVGWNFALNPYEPPENSDASNGSRTRSNPAKPLLYFLGVLGLLQGVVGVPVGLFVGPQILGVAVAMLTFGSTAIWLGHRRFDRFGLWATVAWGAFAVLLIVAATGLQPPSKQDLPGVVFFALLLILVAAVPVVAISKRPGSFVSWPLLTTIVLSDRNSFAASNADEPWNAWEIAMARLPMGRRGGDPRDFYRSAFSPNLIEGDAFAWESLRYRRVPLLACPAVRT